MIRFNASKRLLGSTILTAALAATLGASAGAQSAAPNANATATAETNVGLQDIIVTAERRPEALQTVPIAITAFDANQLRAKGITSTLQLIQYVPNMFGSNNTGLGSANAYYIRGLGNTETIPTFDPPVGTYVDDVYISRQNANNFNFFDLERIEVLRGPQGTLFGRNTTAGAVAVILAKPGDRLGGYAELGYGSYNRWMGRASVDIPFSENFAIKISGYYQNDNGYVYDSITKEHLNDSDMSGIRGAVRLDVGDHIKWNAALSYMYNAGENLLNFKCDPANPSNCNGRFSTTGLLQNWPSGLYNPYAPATVTGAKATYPLGNVVKTTMLTSNLQWVGEKATLSLITGVVNTSQDYALDFADGRGLPSALIPYPTVHGYPSGGFTIANQGQFNEFTQEVKLNGKLFGDKMDYVVGAYFFNENNNSDFADVFNLGPIFGIPGNVGFPAVLADRRLVNTTNASALYGQIDYHATSQLTLTGGVRWTDESKTFSMRDNRAQCTNTPNPPKTCLGNANLFANGVAIPLDQNTKQWTPKFVATWQQNASLMFYASATNGFKSGGWNARGTTNDSLLPFEPENAWSYELGMKSQWLDNRLRANLTFFYLDVSNLQTPSAAVSSTGSVSFITQNFADYHNQGFELELTAVPIEHLSLFGSVGYQNDKYVVNPNVPDFNIYGVKSVPFQQRECQAQLAAGKIPLGGGASNASSCAAGIIDSFGNISSPVRTPQWSVAVGGTYNFPIPTAGIVISPTVNVVYNSSLETGTGNGTIWTGSVTSKFNGQVYPANPFSGDFIAGSYTGPSTIVNASLALTTDDNHWLVSVECTNCFNTMYSQSSLVNYNYYNPPVMWSIRAKRTF